jgi:hypothetical protein
MEGTEYHMVSTRCTVSMHKLTKLKEPNVTAQKKGTKCHIVSTSIPKCKTLKFWPKSNIFFHYEDLFDETNLMLWSCGYCCIFNKFGQLSSYIFERNHINN